MNSYSSSLKPDGRLHVESTLVFWGVLVRLSDAVVLCAYTDFCGRQRAACTTLLGRRRAFTVSGSFDPPQTGIAVSGMTQRSVRAGSTPHPAGPGPVPATICRAYRDHSKPPTSHSTVKIRTPKNKVVTSRNQDDDAAGRDPRSVRPKAEHTIRRRRDLGKRRSVKTSTSTQNTGKGKQEKRRAATCKTSQPQFTHRHRRRCWCNRGGS